MYFSCHLYSLLIYVRSLTWSLSVDGSISQPSMSVPSGWALVVQYRPETSQLPSGRGLFMPLSVCRPGHEYGEVRDAAEYAGVIDGWLKASCGMSSVSRPGNPSVSRRWLIILEVEKWRNWAKWCSNLYFQGSHISFELVNNGWDQQITRLMIANENVTLRGSPRKRLR